MNPPLVLVETGCAPEGLGNDLIVTKEDAVTLVALTWDEPMEPELIQGAIEALSDYEGEHPRIDLVLERLRAWGGKES